MHDIKSRLHRLLDESERPLKHIANDAEVSYDRLKNWFTGRTEVLDANDAERVHEVLTGRGFAR